MLAGNLQPSELRMQATKTDGAAGKTVIKHPRNLVTP